MNIIGRVTTDAKVKTLKDDRQVVEFSIAVNDYFRRKGSEKGETTTNYFNCSYWVNPKRAEQLKKGALVELQGRLSVNAYTNMEGDAKASLNFHVNTITIHQFAKSDTVTEPVPASTNESTDDLPF